MTEKRRERKGRGTEFTQRDKGNSLCLSLVDFSHLIVLPLSLFLRPHSVGVTFGQRAKRGCHGSKRFRDMTLWK